MGAEQDTARREAGLQWEKSLTGWNQLFFFLVDAPQHCGCEHLTPKGVKKMLAIKQEKRERVVDNKCL